MSNDKFYKNYFIIALSNLIIGIASFVFSIVLSKELDTEGLGLYGLIMPVYYFLLCLVSEGLVTAISNLSAVYYGKNDFKNLARTVETGFFFIFFWAVIIALSVFLNSTYIGSRIIKDPRSLYAIKAICPALLFVPFSAILKGHFYGTGKFIIPASIDIFEKFLRIVVLCSTITLLSLNSVEGTVTAAYCAITVGEFTSFILLYTSYKVHQSKFNLGVSNSKSRLQLLFDVLIISFPLCLNGIFSAAFSALSTLLLPQRLVSAGIPYHLALSLIGEFTRMALNVTFLPMMVIGSMSTVLIPELSLRLSEKNYQAIERRITQVLKLACLIGISTLIIGLCIPEALGRLFYGRSDLGAFIKFATLSSVASFIAMPTFGVLSGLGKQKALLKNSLVVSLQELILLYVLVGIPSINIYGVGVTLLITSLTTLILNFHEIMKVCRLKLSIAKIVAYIFSGTLAYTVLEILDSILHVLPTSLFTLKTVVIIVSGFILVFSFASLADQKDSAPV